MRYATNQNKCTTLVPNNVARGVDFRERREGVAHLVLR